MKIKSFIRRHSVIIYFLLAFILSWGLVIVLAKPSNIPINPEASGDILPLLYVSMLVGPGMAGLLMIGVSDGKKGLGNLISRLFRWRVNIWWYVLAIFATPLLALLILFVLSVFFSGIQIELFQTDNMVGLILTGVVVGILVGLFEELGWTGFVTPRLLKRNNILISGFIIGILWGGWHYILFWEKDSYSGILPFLILAGRLFSWLPPFRVLMVWIYNRTGSLLLTILTHMSLVLTTTVVVPMSLSGLNLFIWLFAWGATLWIIVFIMNGVKLLSDQITNG